MLYNDFRSFHVKFLQNFNDVIARADKLYQIACDKDELWNLYLDSFPEGTNNIFRTRREYDCSCCRHFIKQIGNVCIIENNNIRTLWNFDSENSTFQPVIDALDKYLMSKPITDVYVTKDSFVGTPSSFEETDTGIIEWDHFYLSLPSKFVTYGRRTNGDIQGEFRDTRNVFKRSLDEISGEAIETVLELIADGSLYRGNEWKTHLQNFLTYKREYDNLTDAEKANYTWDKAATVGQVIGRIRNHSIGTLLIDITSGEDLETAVKKFESLVAPTNYKRPKPIFTQKMVESAKKTLSDLGYLNSLDRRYATLDDISVNNICFCNKDAKKRVQGGDVFDALMKETKSAPKKFDRVEEVAIDRFITEILPTAQAVEAYVENKHAGNFVSLIAPVDKNAPSMFKWDNAFGWAYAGNITDSDIRENVKNAGGSVDGVLRFSIQWNDFDEHDENDVDAHCITSTGEEIYYARTHDWKSGGELDVDITHPFKGYAAVENITFPKLSRLPKGDYKFFVHCYCDRGGRSGFRAEIDANGMTHRYDYRHSLRHKENVEVAVVHYDGNGNFTIKDKLDSTEGVNSRKIWNIDTHTFVPVTTIMNSPNYWDEQNGNGNLHWFFMLDNCINPEQPNGFYNEFLIPELIPHRKVLESLGSKLAVAKAEDQLSGIGFSSTKRNELIVKVTGATERILKIKF